MPPPTTPTTPDTTVQQLGQHIANKGGRLGAMHWLQSICCYSSGLACIGMDDHLIYDGPQLIILLLKTKIKVTMALWVNAVNTSKRQEVKRTRGVPYSSEQCRWGAHLTFIWPLSHQWICQSVMHG